jgi:hypothetical protein
MSLELQIAKSILKGIEKEVNKESLKKGSPLSQIINPKPEKQSYLIFCQTLYNPEAF